MRDDPRPTDFGPIAPRMKELQDSMSVLYGMDTCGRTERRTGLAEIDTLPLLLQTRKLDLMNSSPSSHIRL